MSYDPHESNPFADDPDVAHEPKPAGGTGILIALLVVCAVVMLMCGGIIAGGMYMVQQVRRDFDQLTEDALVEAELQQYAMLLDEGRYEEALAELDAALLAEPNNPGLHNAKGWLLATCPDDALRDGRLAVEHGTTACELSNWSRPEFVDTLAAAYAESGDFEEAVRWQREAIDLGPTFAVESYHERLELFQQGLPYREGVPPISAPAEAAGGGDAPPDEAASPEEAAADVEATPPADAAPPARDEEAGAGTL